MPKEPSPLCFSVFGIVRYSVCYQKSNISKPSHTPKKSENDNKKWFHIDKIPCTEIG